MRDRSMDGWDDAMARQMAAEDGLLGPVAQALSSLPCDATPDEQIARLLSVGGECTQEGLRRLIARCEERRESTWTVRSVALSLGVRT